jgi:hypothetical protein
VEDEAMTSNPHQPAINQLREQLVEACYAQRELTPFAVVQALTEALLCVLLDHANDETAAHTTVDELAATLHRMLDATYEQNR